MQQNRGPARRFVLFILLSLFAVAQVSWWVIFQVQVGDRMTRMHERLWTQQVETARLFAATHQGQFRDTEEWLGEAFADLTTDASGAIIVDPEARAALERETSRLVRMFALEGSTFTILLIGGVLLMYWTMRRELRMERRQASFFVGITHELKTPITAVRLYLETLLERDPPPPQRRELLGNMREDLDRLQGLIDRLLQARAMLRDGTRRRAPRLDLSSETREVVRDAESSLSGVHDFTLEQHIEEGIVARMDPQAWSIVVRNLLENAVKYSPAGARVELALERLGGRTRLRVRDEGAGFLPADRSRIFQRFVRLGNEATRRTPGAGLGLYLVRELVRDHGGRVSARSEGPGKGAEFRVTLPRYEEA